MDGNEQTTDYRIERDIAVLSTEVKNIRKDLDDIKELLKVAANRYVSSDELENKLDPIRRIVYGMTSAILLAFIGCVIALVWKTAS
jgi:hypothetical protein